MWSQPKGRARVIPNWGPFNIEKRERRCSSCGRIFVNIDDLHRHVNLTHNGRRPYLCSICGIRFEKAMHLSSHFKVHFQPVQKRKSVVFASRTNPSVYSEPIPTTYTPAVRLRSISPDDTSTTNSYRSVSLKTFGTRQTFTVTNASRTAVSDSGLPGRQAKMSDLALNARTVPYTWTGKEHRRRNTPRVIRRLAQLPPRLQLDKDDQPAYSGIL